MSSNGRTSNAPQRPSPQPPAKPPPPLPKPPLPQVPKPPQPSVTDPETTRASSSTAAAPPLPATAVVTSPSKARPPLVPSRRSLSGKRPPLVTQQSLSRKGSGNAGKLFPQESCTTVAVGGDTYTIGKTRVTIFRIGLDCFVKVVSKYKLQSYLALHVKLAPLQRV